MSEACLICKAEAVYGDLCKDCWLGLKCFGRSVKLLGRATAYLSRKGNLRTKFERRAKRHRTSQIEKLKREQWRDDHDREMRFDHAVNKDG